MKIAEWLPGLVKMLLDILVSEGVIKKPLSDEEKHELATKAVHTYLKS